MPYSDQVAAAPVRQHVQKLLDGGMSITQIQGLSGVNRTAIRVLLGTFPNRKPSAQVRELTASRLLRTRLDRGATVDGLVPSIGTRRRLQALQALGYTQADLSTRLGYAKGSRALQFARQDLIRAENALRVAGLYEELSDTLGPSSRSREFARNRGWLPPAWWDDDSIDDPQVEAEGTRTYVHGGRVLLDDVTLPRSVRVERMTKLGLGTDEIAKRIGTLTRYVRRDRINHSVETPTSGPDYLGRLTPSRVGVDDVAIERRMAGERVTLNSAERDEALRRLHAQGLTDTAITKLLGVSGSTVLDTRQRLGLVANERTSEVVIDADHFSARGAKRRREERAAS